MGRPSKGHDLKISVTARYDPDLIREIDEIVKIMYSDRSKILAQCIRHGLQAFKNSNPDIAHRLDAARKQHLHQKTASRKS